MPRDAPWKLGGKHRGKRSEEAKILKAAPKSFVVVFVTLVSSATVFRRFPKRYITNNGEKGNSARIAASIHSAFVIGSGGSGKVPNRQEGRQQELFEIDIEGRRRRSRANRIKRRTSSSSQDEVWPNKARYIWEKSLSFLWKTKNRKRHQTRILSLE